MASRWGYFDDVSEEFSLRVSQPLGGISSGYADQAKAGVSTSVNAFDAVVKGTMAIASIPDGVVGSLVAPFLSKLNLTGMAILP